MKRSQQLPLNDMREVFRLLGHARELRNDYAQQEVVLIDGMTKLLDADLGHAVKVEGYRPETDSQAINYVPGSTQDTNVNKYMSEWSRNSNFEEDPLTCLAKSKTSNQYTFSRSSVMTYDQVRPHRIFDEMVEPAGLHDVILTFFRYPHSNKIRQYAFQRTIAKPEFNMHERRLASLFISELHQLYTEGHLEPTSLLNKLPNRLALMAHQLRTGKSQKQIASSENLSYHTVRSYTKELYDTVGVSSREELVVRLFINDVKN